jgi:UPF0755 protein
MRKTVLRIGVLFAGCLGFLVALLSPVQTRHPYAVSYLVLPGESFHDVAADLQTLGLIREHRTFTAMARLLGKARKVKAGPYRAASDEWAWTILDRMVRGDVQDTSVTVPEGLWMTEVAERLAPWIDGGADGFLAAARDSALLAELGIPGSSAEGDLFPETYRIRIGNRGAEVVRQMVGMFDEVWSRDLQARARERGLTRSQVVTLASIVEAEAHLPEERPRIAAVYLNRLARRLPLQADPTVHYALGRRLTRTLLDDLKVPSPYNTYLAPGLPPGPICNPGLGSLRAVLWPAENCRDLYFVARGDGSHLFAPDFAGHLRNRSLVRAAVEKGSH